MTSCTSAISKAIANKLHAEVLALMKWCRNALAHALTSSKEQKQISRVAAIPAKFHATGYIPLRLTRSEEHTSELQSLMRISYAVFCLKKNKTLHSTTNTATLHSYRTEH